jgi:CheY-like chemotaxis protein
MLKTQTVKPSPKPRILVIEDDMEDQEIFSRVFNDKTDCCELLFLEDGAKAVKLLKNLPWNDFPNLIIIDYNLPGFNGCQTIEGLDRIQGVKEIPKVIYSTHTDQKTIDYCLKAGAKAYFRKSNTEIGVMRDIDHILAYIPE